MNITSQVVRSVEKFARISLGKPSATMNALTLDKAHRKKQEPFHRLLATKTGSRIEANTANSEKPGLIIFDKDGTLICFHSMWIPWAVDTAKRLEEETGLLLSPKVYQLLGVCPIEEKVRPGLLAEGTMEQIKVEIQKLLVQNGVSDSHKLNIVEKCIKDSQSRSPSTLRAIHDMRSLFKTLRNNDVKIAMCTADNRTNTVSMLRWFDVEDLVDIVVCGDDPGSKPKPHPHNAKSICRVLQVAPENAVMVGDTLADIDMARSAGLGAAVGVLSGVGGLDYLRPHADILIPHVGNLLPIFLGIEHSNMV
ncbi:hypothetical protein KIN20_006736 [Parelaphostrongylus tenuis]|uniref:Uncharacterized protein n=1 Tax=Parelaphostrongylus tenuis TaxID=148309 RepID=A0AAD5MKJ4_PARTN|nr:hypothetical protein KIN20_006736 [Parelaphostrongylus tenuis]